MTALVRRRHLSTLEIEPMFRLAAGDTATSFMRARYLGIGMSILLSLASVALFVNPGLNYGIDFKGGIQIEVETSGPADLAGLREELGGLGLGEIALQDRKSTRLNSSH